MESKLSYSLEELPSSAWEFVSSFLNLKESVVVTLMTKKLYSVLLEHIDKSFKAKCGHNYEDVAKFRKAGPTHSDTMMFDDYADLIKTAVSKGLAPRIIKIKVLYQNRENIGGIETSYLMKKRDGSSGFEVVKTKHVATAGHIQVMSEMEYEFEEGEYMIRIELRIGGVIERMRIFTNHYSLPVIDVGTRNYRRTENIEDREKPLLAFAGGHNGHLHNLFAYLA